MSLSESLPMFHDGKRVARTPRERRIARKLARQAEPGLRLRRGVFLYADGTQPLFARIVRLSLSKRSREVAEAVAAPNALYEALRR